MGLPLSGAMGGLGGMGGGCTSTSKLPQQGNNPLKGWSRYQREGRKAALNWEEEEYFFCWPGETQKKGHHGKDGTTVKKNEKVITRKVQKWKKGTGGPQEKRENYT